MALDMSRQDAQPSAPHHASHNVATSTSDSRLDKTFRRSSGSFSGGGVLGRLASASSSSSRSQQPHSPIGAEPKRRRPSIGQRLSSRQSRKSVDGTGGANLAELSKPNGKFKSGIKWDSQQSAPEPFMEASDSTAQEAELASALQAQSALASGSTAAAQAHAQSRGLGQPIFQNASSVPTTTRTSSISSSMTALSQLPSVSQTITAIGNSGVHPDILGSTRSSAMHHEPSSAVVAAPAPAPAAVTKTDFGTAPPLETETDTRSGDGATPCITPPVRSRDGSNSDQGTADNHMLARAAQLVLEAARQQARVETRKKGKSAPASPKRSTFGLSPVATATSADSHQDNSAVQQSDQAQAASELSRTPSQRARSKSDAGGESQVKRRKSFLRSVSSKARRNRSEASSDVPGAAGSGTPTPSANSPTSPSAATSGTVTPGGRRRRYVDTRDLDLLARELAAEAIAEQIPQPPFARASRSGSSSPHRTKAGFNDPRRRSFPSILEDSPLQNDTITPVHSATNGLKPMTPLIPSNPSRNLSRAKLGDANAKALPASHSDPTKGLVPKEMFLGLGGSPYPSLPPPSSRSTSANLNGIDPFGIPLTQESSPFDATMAYANKTSVYHTPNQVAASRSRSNASSLSTSPANSNNKRRPVLTMTMNDPQAELQGLTKPPKESSGKRLTPFGSRASSRAPSPSPSFTNLKKAAAEQKEAEQHNVAAQDVSVGNQETVSTVDTQNFSAAAMHSPDNSLRPEDASVIASRRNSMAPSEMSICSGLTPPVKAKKMNRLSAIFRSNRSRVEVDTISTVKPASNNASLATSPVLSTYATPAAELPSFNVSPHSAAVSAGSDADVSPVAFRNIALPPMQDTHRSSKPASAVTSADASRRSSVTLDSAERATTKKRPVRALLRRLSSFSSSKKKESKDDKSNFPDASTMPVVDMDKLKQLSEAKDVKVEGQDARTVTETIGVPTFASMGASHDTAVAGPDVAETDKGVAPALHGLDLSNASPAPVNEEMAKNGFGTRSAYKLGAGAGGVTGVERHYGSKREEAGDMEESGKEEDVMMAKENIWDRSRPAQITRSDSQTPSSEDSFFNESRPSITSRPGSGALMKHGSESAISEELHTPDPSTAYLPATKEGGLEDATLSSTLSSTVSSATAAAAANGVIKSPVMTASPSEPVQSVAL